DDIPLLVDHFLARFNARLGRDVHGVTPEATAAMMAHPWPGNIRELENLIERAVLLAEQPLIGLGAMPGLEGMAPSADAPEDIEDMGLKAYVRAYTAKLERARIRRVLSAEGGNVTRAAKRLEISRKSLQMKMKEYGLRDAPDAGRGSR
ncbi:MAG: helix-turn-helix domain-containing protein, partial [Myxococcota bacterium]|nr:helix-turn-helix domain-containing protein [Myxococcota bacterium]